MQLHGRGIGRQRALGGFRGIREGGDLVGEVQVHVLVDSSVRNIRLDVHPATTERNFNVCR